MYYSQLPHHPTSTKQDPKLTQLRQDNIQLEKALQQLNSCYQQKIFLLEEQLKASTQKEETLLEWKSAYIDKELFNNSKYEKELERLVSMMEEMAQNYEKDNSEFRKQLEEKDQEIVHLKDQNLYLRQQNQAHELKVEGLAQKYIVEIERLNHELAELKDEVNNDRQDEQIQNEEDQAIEALSKLTIQGQREETLEDAQYFSEDQQSTSQIIYGENFIQSEEVPFPMTQINPLKDISNKNLTPAPHPQKSTYIKGSISVQSSFNS